MAASGFAESFMQAVNFAMSNFAVFAIAKYVPFEKESAVKSKSLYASNLPCSLAHSAAMDAAHAFGCSVWPILLLHDASSGKCLKSSVSDPLRSFRSVFKYGNICLQ